MAISIKGVVTAQSKYLNFSVLAGSLIMEKYATLATAGMSASRYLPLMAVKNAAAIKMTKAMYFEINAFSMV